LLNVEEDEAGRLAGFRARFGRGFDAGREAASSTKASDGAVVTGTKTEEGQRVEDAGLEDNGFAEEEDANLLDLISSFGQESGARSHKKGSGKGK
jgi:hypothetical protein